METLAGTNVTPGLGEASSMATGSAPRVVSRSPASPRHGMPLAVGRLKMVTPEAPLQRGQQGVESPISGNLWQVQAAAGSHVRAGDVLVVLESMKMEIPLLAPCDGVVQQMNVQPGASVRAGQRVAVILEENV